MDRSPGFHTRARGSREDPRLPVVVAPPTCAACATTLEPGQRYCVDCGHRVGAPLPPGPAAVAARGVALPSRRVSAALAVAMLAAGIALGSAAGPGTSASLAAAPGRLITIVQGPGAPAPVAAAPAAPPAAPEAGGDATSDAGGDDTATTDAAPADAAPAEDTPTEDTPTDDTPADDTPAEDTPADDTPADDTPPATPPVPGANLPPIKHVWVVWLADLGYDQAYGSAATSSYLAKELRDQGTLLQSFFGVAHGGLASGVALLSGQAPNPATQAGCPAPAGPVAPGTVAGDDVYAQVAGTGCLYPASTLTLLDQLSGSGRTWRAYVPAPDCTPTTVQPRVPLTAFPALRGASCAQDVVGLDRLAPDLAGTAAPPSFSLIVPDACHDAGAVPCAPGAPAGPQGAEPFLRQTLGAIQATKAYKDAGLIVVLADQAPQSGPGASSAGMGSDAQLTYPNTPSAGGTVLPGAGGGQVGALLLSPFSSPGQTVGATYDDFSLLRTFEDLFRLDRLGYAGDPSRRSLGAKAFGAFTPKRRSQDVHGTDTGG